LFADLTDADYELGLRSKLMGQVTLARIAKDHLHDGGSITLTTGMLAMHPMPGSASVSMVNAGLEGFVRAAALEAADRSWFMTFETDSKVRSKRTCARPRSTQRAAQYLVAFTASPGRCFAF